MAFKIPQRYQLLVLFGAVFITLSTLTRIAFFFWSFSEIGFSVIHLLRIVCSGIFFDLGTVSYFLLPYALYLLFFPSKLTGNIFDKIVTYFAFTIGLITFVFTAFAEFTFWNEFKSRFNFISVDYLVYTNEVVGNINESYNVPASLSFIFSLVIAIYYFTHKKQIFKNTFTHQATFKEKFPIALFIVLVMTLFTAFIRNEDAEWSTNRYENELSKAGIYSFFSAFRNNELSYTDFYITQNEETAFAEVKKHVLADNEQLLNNNSFSLKRHINNPNEEQKPNVIFICIESFSAEFMARYNNTYKITPYLDELIKESFVFDNLYATGTRTVRGMESIMLSIPPSPGRSIVKRENNTGLFNIGTVFKSKGYKDVFFYGGDGYFDNMNAFFGGNGFDIVDRGRGYLMGDDFTSKRTNITDDELTFENAWGVCDEDIYNKVIKEADKNYKEKQPFFNFVMTTSNHRPYSYPDNKIDIPSGSSRQGAVKYTDFAIHQFIEKAKTKPWFDNTVFVIMADHCASSAGKKVLDVAKYHIPAFIYNLKTTKPKAIEKVCSQIDVFPTLFGLLNWSYDSQLLGRDVMKIKSNNEFAFVSNYRKMGFFKTPHLMVLGEQKKANYYVWNKVDNTLKDQPIDDEILKLTSSYYTYSNYLYQKGLLK